ncbi:MAG: DUF4375 domain-containing protein [Dehalococcoidia bacterium]|nr:DUF4375 domain-containing protein [Dehalococcoidia bacterium]
MTRTPLITVLMMSLLLSLAAACGATGPAAAPDAPEATARGLVEPMRGKVALDQGSAALFRDLANYSVRERFLFAVLACADEVRAGDFRRFFASPEGIMGPEAIAGLRAMGMVNTAAVAQKAANVLGREFPRDLAERRRAVDANVAALNTLDAEFTQLLSVEAGGIDVATDRLARMR